MCARRIASRRHSLDPGSSPEGNLSHDGAFLPAINGLNLQPQGHNLTPLFPQQHHNDKETDDRLEQHLLCELARVVRSRRGFAMSSACTPSLELCEELPIIKFPQASYARKVFIGGFPKGERQAMIHSIFYGYHPCEIEFPEKRSQSHAYLIFRNEAAVVALLNACCYNAASDDFNFGVWVTEKNHKLLQVKPWVIQNSVYQAEKVRGQDFGENMVFVGNLHGTITAVQLKHILEKLFGRVLFCGIDTDKYQHPCGSARVTFESREAFLRAVQVEHVKVETIKFTKVIQIDPHIIENRLCSYCQDRGGPVFCRSLLCLKYFCATCYFRTHRSALCPGHVPLMKKISIPR